MKSVYIKPFIPLVAAIAETFGKNCEVVLHDFSKPDHSIIKIANSHVTGRDVSGPATGLILPFIGKRTKNESIVGYRTKTKKGAELKSTTVFIKDRNDKVVGALCINMDMTPYISAKNVLDELCTIRNIANKKEVKESVEKFESNVDSVIDELIQQSIKKIGNPVVNMRKKDKLQAIRDLKEKGLFLIKGSARRVSEELNVSLATTYKYLEEIG